MGQHRMGFNAPDSAMIFFDSERVWHVSKIGNDNNSGHAYRYPVSLANDAFLTIQHAINEASAGDTIIVWPGDYVENVTLAVKGNVKNMTIIGRDRDTTRIVPLTGKPLELTDGSYIKNLSCIGAVGSASQGIIHGSGLVLPGGITIDGCYVFGEVDGLLMQSTTKLFMFNSTFVSNYDGASIRGISEVVAENCSFRGTGGVATSTHSLYLSSRGIFKRCVFSIETADTSALEAGCVYSALTGSSADKPQFNECNFILNCSAGRTGSCYGYKSNNASADTELNGCLFSTVAPGAAGGVMDIINSAGRIRVANCLYDPLKTSGSLIT